MFNKGGMNRVFWRHFSPSALARGSLNSKVRDVEQGGFEVAKEQQEEKKKPKQTTPSFIL